MAYQQHIVYGAPSMGIPFKCLPSTGGSVLSGSPLPIVQAKQATSSTPPIGGPQPICNHQIQVLPCCGPIIILSKSERGKKSKRGKDKKKRKRKESKDDSDECEDESDDSDDSDDDCKESEDDDECCRRKTCRERMKERQARRMGRRLARLLGNARVSVPIRRRRRGGSGGGGGF